MLLEAEVLDSIPTADDSQGPFREASLPLLTQHGPSQPPILRVSPDPLPPKRDPGKLFPWPWWNVTLDPAEVIRAPWQDTELAL